MIKHPGKIGLGIIGCGKSAEVYQMLGLAKVENIDIVGSSDTDEKRLSIFSERFRIPHRFVDYREMLTCSDVDAVAVITPTQFHADVASHAMAAGKHVFIDKPLALNAAECNNLIAQAEQNTGIVAMVGFNLRWHRLVSKAMRIIQSGRLGEIKAVRSTYTHWHPGDTAQHWHRKREHGGGILFNEIVHHFDLWRLFLGSEIHEIYSASQPSEYFDDDTGAVTARFANGVLASGIFSYSSSPNSEIEIFGKMARMRISLYRIDGLEIYSNQEYPGDIKGRFNRCVDTIRDLPQTVDIMRKGGDFNLTYYYQWRHFADCILGKTTPECTLDDGKRAVETALAAIESASSGRPVKINQAPGDV